MGLMKMQEMQKAIPCLEKQFIHWVIQDVGCWFAGYYVIGYGDSEKKFTIKYFKAGAERASKVMHCSNEDKLIEKLMYKDDEDDCTDDEEMDEDDNAGTS